MSAENKRTEIFNGRKGMFINEYVDLFEYCIQTQFDGQYNDESVFAAISIVSEKLGNDIEARSGAIDKTFANIIVDAYEYIYSLLFDEDDDVEAVVEMFDGEFPLIVTVGETLKFELFKEDVDKTISDFSEIERQLFDAILEAIWEEDSDRVLSLADQHIFIPAIIEEEREEMLYYIAKDIIKDFVLENVEEYGGCVLFFSKELGKKRTVSALLNCDGFVSVIEADELASVMINGNKKGKFNISNNIKFEDFNIEF